MAVSDYKTDPNENTTISGINIAEGCAPSGINNAIRQLMADVKADKTAQDTATAKRVKTVNNNAPDANGNITPAQTGCLPLTGGTMTGVINSIANVAPALCFYDGNNAGGNLYLFSSQHESYLGGFILRAFASDNTTYKDFTGKANGTLTWNGSTVFLPAGAVFAFAGNSTPSGCFLCNGATVSRTTYAALFAAIGTTYGSGDGSTTFNLPNLSDMRYIEGNTTSGVYRDAGLPNVKGELSKLAYQYYTKGDGALSLKNGEVGFYSAGSTTNAINVATLVLSANGSNSIYGKSKTVTPKSLTMRYYIKY